MSGKFYAVKAGRIPGIYTTWKETSSQTNGFSGALFKSFATKLEALQYLYDGQIPPDQQIEAPVSLIGQITRTEKGLPPLMIKVCPNNAPPSLITKTPPIVFPVVKCSVNDYVKVDRSILNTPDDFTVIYIDGSKRPSVNHRGSGAYCRYAGKDYSMSIPCTQDVLGKYSITPEEFAKMSSPSMEYLALSEVLFRLVPYGSNVDENQALKSLMPRHIAFVGDYNGVKFFTEGSWKATKTYIIKIRDVVLKLIEYLRTKSVTISIHHVDGHVGILGNELSDIMAKSTVAYDDFPLLCSNMMNSVIY